MQKQNETDKSGVEQIPQGDLIHQLEDLSKWLNERTWPLTGGLMFIAIIYLYSFICVEQVPVSITSSSLVSSLPWFMGLLVLFILLIAALLLVPTMTLFVPEKKGGTRRMIDVWLPQENTNEKKISSAINRMWWVWMAVLIYFAILFIIMVCAVPREWFDNHPVLMLLGSLIAAIVAVFILRYRMVLIEVEAGMGLKARLRRMFTDVAPDFWMVAFVGSAAQFIAIATISIPLAELLQLTPENKFGLSLLMLLIAAGLGAFQWLGARFVFTLTRPNFSLKKSLVHIVIAIAVLGIYQPAGASLTRFIFGMTASGARPCVVMTWSEDIPKGLREIDAKGRGTSLPLSVRIQLDGYYYVRLVNQITRKIYLIPVEKVAAIDACQKRKSTGD